MANIKIKGTSIGIVFLNGKMYRPGDLIEAEVDEKTYEALKSNINIEENKKVGSVETPSLPKTDFSKPKVEEPTQEAKSPKKAKKEVVEEKVELEDLDNIFNE